MIMQITRWKSTTWKTLNSHSTEKRSFLLPAKSKHTTSTDFDTYNEYIGIDGPELGSYWFSSILMWAENADENMQRKKQFAKFRMLQIEEDKHFHVISIFVTLSCWTEVIPVRR